MLAQRPGCHGACSAGDHPHVDPGDRADPAGQFDRRPPSRPAGRHPTSRGVRPDPASTAARCSGWFGSAAFEHGERRGVGLAVDRGPRRRRRVAAGQEHRADLEHQTGPGCRETCCAARCPAARAAGWCASAAGRRPAGWPAAPPRRRTSSAGRPSPSSSAAPMNGKDSTSVSPAEARSAAISRSRRCAGGQPGAGRGLRQHRRDGVEPLQPGDLLDQVGRPGQVGPPARRGNRQTSARGPSRRPRSRPARSRRAITARLVRPAGEPLRLAERQLDDGLRQRVARHVGPADDRRRRRTGPAARRPPPRRPPPPPGRRRARTGGTPRSAAGAGGPSGRSPVGSQYAASMTTVGGAGGDLGGLTTHHAGHRDRPGLVGDDQIVGDQGALGRRPG